MALESKRLDAWRLVTESARLFFRVHGFTGSVASRCLLAVLPDDAIADLSHSIYSSLKFGSRDWNEKGLFEWETAFVEKYLGGKKCRVLIPGCGGGREALFLARRSCAVVAFDPVVDFLVTFRNVANEEDLHVKIFHGSIEEMLKEGPGRRSEFPAVCRDSIEAEGPFDAVMFGWGSATHVMSLDVLVDVLRQLSGAAMCPDGPILMSFWMDRSEPRRGGTISRLFSGIGRRSERETLSGGVYARYFLEEEVEDVVRRGGYKILESNIGDAMNLDYTYYAVLGRR